jgi:polyvinyl alcohol dehydrogenase (cytochrome)
MGARYCDDPVTARDIRTRASGARRRTAAIGCLLLLVAVVAACNPAAGDPTTSPRTRIAPGDWPSYGYDAQHTFHGRTTLTAATAARLKQAWFFPTGDAVTATPTVVGGTIYVGSWDTRFYAIDLRTGEQRWAYQLSRQDAVKPYPGESPRPIDSDGGLVTSSAWYEPGNGHRPDLVIFGAGYTLYALDAHTGRLFWRHDFTGLPEQPPNPDHDGARIFSSPVVANDRVIAAVSVDGQRGERGYVFAANLNTGNPVWTYETDVNDAGQVLNDGCGNVWSSGTLVRDRGLVVFDESDCHFTSTPPTSESVFALRIGNGHLVWRFRPTRPDPLCDFDFGASVNAGVDGQGRTTFLGVGGKDGTYYSLDPATGALRWSKQVVFGGFSGGFVGTTAYDGHRAYGSTALGDFGRFETNGPQLCDPANPADTQLQEPTVHAFDTATGAVAWEATGAASFAPTTVAGGLLFNALALKSEVDVRDAATGTLITALPLQSLSWSGVATVGDAVVFGVGSAADGSHAGVAVFTPDGSPPR